MVEKKDRTGKLMDCNAYIGTQSICHGGTGPLVKPLYQPALQFIEAAFARASFRISCVKVSYICVAFYRVHTFLSIAAEVTRGELFVLLA